MKRRFLRRPYVVAAMLAAIGVAVWFTTRGGLVREGEAYVWGMESYVYGYPMVMMDVTRDVLTAAPAPRPEGTAAPINQLAKMPHYVSPDFKNVVGISLNSLWTTGWVDLEQEPIVLSVTLRDYFPKEAAYDGSYKVPAVRKVDEIEE